MRAADPPGQARHFLRAKITQPPGPDDLVARPRLVARLNAGLTARLTLISAPAGYGKTTAAVQWCRVADRPIAWLSLDPLDNDLPTLVGYLLAAIRLAYPGAAVHSGALQHLEGVPADVLADALIEDLADLPGVLLLVFDDYHVVTDPDIAVFMDRLVRFLSSNVHPVIVSRVDPPLPLSRMRARGELAEVRLDALQFRRDETRRLIDQLTGSNVDEATAARLEARTEGWPIGLRLAAMSRAPGETVSELSARIGDGVSADEADYLLAEVLSLQPPEAQLFLMRCSVLERLTDDLCRAVAGPTHADGGRSLPTLDRLSRANVLLAPLDGRRRWFRLHGLLREVLRRQLHESQPPDEVARLHRRASDWLAAEGMVDDAVCHALAAGDADEAAAIVEAHAGDALDREEHSTLAHWLQLLPEGARRRPDLLLVRAWLRHFMSRMDALPGIAAELDEQLRRDGAVTEARRRALRHQGALLKAIPAYWAGDVATSMALVEGAMPELRAAGPYVRGVAGLYYAASLHGTGRTDEALAYLRAAHDDAGLQSDTSRSRLLLAEALIRLQRADLTGLEGVGNALALVGARSGLPVTTHWANYIHGLVCYERNELAAAERALRAVVRSRFQANGGTANDAYVALTLVLGAQGRSDEADEELARMRGFLVETGAVAALPLVEAARQRLLALRGEATGPLPPAPPPTAAAARAEMHRSYLVLPTLARARCLLQQGTPSALAEAGERLAAMRRAAEDLRHEWRLAETLALGACLASAHGDQAGALDALGRALRIGERGGLIRTFVDCGACLAPLLERLQAGGRRSAYTRRLLRAFAEAGPAPRVADAGTAVARHDDRWVALRGSITDREMDVLVLVDRRLSNREIADRLVIEPETVKKHLQNIYRKLDVDNRREAAAVAHRVGLLREGG